MLPKDCKIFITGATGFLGSYIVRRLVSDAYTDITCLRRVDSETALLVDVNQKVKWVTGDILDSPLLEEIIRNADCVIHAAALVSYDTESKKEMIKMALEGTSNVVNASLSNGIKKFIHISSIAAIGRSKPVELISEKHIFSHSKYDTSYGLAKFLAEQEVWRAHAEGLNVTILNPAMILGPGNWNQSSVQIFKKIYQGMKFYPGGSTGWVDVRDVADAVLKCMTENFNGERFIVSSENISYKNVFEKIAKGLGVKPPSTLLSLKYAPLIWRLEALRAMFSGHRPIINKETVMSTSVLSTYDNNKSLTVLKLKYTPLTETIDTSCHLFMDTYSKGKNFATF